MTETNHRPPDVLECALDALLSEPVPNGPPPELAADTVRSLESSTKSPYSLRLQHRKELMIRIARYSGLSAAGIALVTVIGWFALMNETSTVAFGDVIKNVRKAESVTMTNRQKIGRSPEFKFRISIQGFYYRMDVPGHFTSIADWKSKKAIQINHAKKIAYEYPLGKEAAKRFGNPIDHFLKLRPEDAKRQSDVKLNGKTSYVYVVNKIDFLGFQGVGELKIWVDPKTKLPLKIRLGVNSRAGAKPMDRPFDTIMIYEDFQWNKKLDPKLFELKVPSGYKTVPGAPGPKKAN